jgi:hypothetical protein
MISFSPHSSHVSTICCSGKRCTYTHLLRAPFGASRCCGFSEPLGRAEGNFAYSQDGHKINDAVVQSTYARRQVGPPLQLNIKLRLNPALVSLTGMGAGLRAPLKMLRVAELTVYTSSYEMAKCPQVRNGKSAH